jgi:hypothetical protein
MSYLFGDSTPSTLETDYIDFLRDAVDYAVQVLLADQRIAEEKTKLEALEKSTAAESERIQKAGELVPKALEGASLGEPESPAARCAAAIVRSAAELVSGATAEVRAAYDAEARRREADAAQERKACVEALERLLIKHDLPGTRSELRIALARGGHYGCQVRLSTGFGVDASLELDVPIDHLFERVVRVDRLVERLDVQAPELGGWLHKEIKLRPQHLDKLHVAGLSVGAAGDTLSLRAAPDGTGAGFDLEFTGTDAIRLLRVEEGEKREDPPFDVDAADIPKLQGLRGKLIAAATELKRHRRTLVEAKLDGESLRGHARPSLLAERLVAAMTPVVQEIASRSQSPGELVLRKRIGDARREEIFLSKQELKNKLGPLSERNRSLFEPLWVVPPPGAPSLITLPPIGVPSAPSAISTAVPPPPPTRLDLHPPAEIIELVDSGAVSIVQRAPSVPNTDLDIVVEERSR